MAFLNTLTDSSFLTNPMFSNPFVTLPGDYDGNGVVDTADYVVWRMNLGDTTSLVADGSGNHVVDQADYDVWRQNFGRTWLDLATRAGALGQTVPEPSGAALAIILLAWGTWSRALARRRRAPS